MAGLTPHKNGYYRALLDAILLRMVPMEWPIYLCLMPLTALEK